MTAVANGVIAVGKLQGTHSRLCMIDSVDLENIDSADVVSVYDMYSVSGKGIDGTIAGYEEYSSDDLKKYLFSSSGKNHVILIKGNFDLSTVLITYHNLGRR